MKTLLHRHRDRHLALDLQRLVVCGLHLSLEGSLCRLETSLNRRHAPVHSPNNRIMADNGDFFEEEDGVPVQIIAIDEENSKFKLNEEILDEVLSKVPKGMKLSVVSIVGAFRTGKSCLLYTSPSPRDRG